MKMTSGMVLTVHNSIAAVDTCSNTVLYIRTLYYCLVYR